MTRKPTPVLTDKTKAICRVISVRSWNTLSPAECAIKLDIQTDQDKSASELRNPKNISSWLQNTSKN